eukprot:gene30107-37596_t
MVDDLPSSPSPSVDGAPPSPPPVAPSGSTDLPPAVHLNTERSSLHPASLALDLGALSAATAPDAGGSDLDPFRLLSPMEQLGLSPGASSQMLEMEFVASADTRTRSPDTVHDDPSVPSVSPSSPGLMLDFDFAPSQHFLGDSPIQSPSTAAHNTARTPLNDESPKPAPGSVSKMVDLFSDPAALNQESSVSSYPQLPTPVAALSSPSSPPFEEHPRVAPPEPGKRELHLRAPSSAATSGASIIPPIEAHRAEDAAAALLPQTEAQLAHSPQAPAASSVDHLSRTQPSLSPELSPLPSPTPPAYDSELPSASGSTKFATASPPPLTIPSTNPFEDFTPECPQEMMQQQEIPSMQLVQDSNPF